MVIAHRAIHRAVDTARGWLFPALVASVFDVRSHAPVLVFVSPVAGEGGDHSLRPLCRHEMHYCRPASGLVTPVVVVVVVVAHWVAFGE